MRRSLALINGQAAPGTLAVVSLVALLGCGGGNASTSSGSGSGSGSGSETPVVSGEDEGFDDDGFGDGEPSVDHGTQSAHALIGVHPPPVPFSQMSDSDKEMYMVGTVLPIAAESFRGYSEERFAQFECANCHGDDAAERRYEMPSRSLPPLAAPGSPQWQRMEGTPAFTFMNDVVTPETAILLGEERISADHPTGFGCFNCHPHAGS